jgi:hypothetical protein
MAPTAPPLFFLKQEAYDKLRALQHLGRNNEDFLTKPELKKIDVSISAVTDVILWIDNGSIDDSKSTLLKMGLTDVSQAADTLLKATVQSMYRKQKEVDKMNKKQLKEGAAKAKAKRVIKSKKPSASSPQEWGPAAKSPSKHKKKP